MQVEIEGRHTEGQPALQDWITARLDELNVPHVDILHARVVIDKATHHMHGADAVMDLLRPTHAVHGLTFEQLAVGMVVELNIAAGNAGPQASRVIPR